MIHSKNHNSGFTLMETMLSMMIIGLVLTPIFLLHGMIMQRVNRSSQHFYALLVGKQLLFQARQKQEVKAHEFTLNNADQTPSVTAAYTLQSGVNAQSSLHSLTGLHREVVTLEWQERGQKRTDTLIAFVYKQPEQKKA